MDGLKPLNITIMERRCTDNVFNGLDFSFRPGNPFSMEWCITQHLMSLRFRRIIIEAVQKEV